MSRVKAGKDVQDSEMDVEDQDFDSDLGDEEIDEELALPPLLSDIGYNEKKELLRFKRTHNERDWEEEILRRTDLLARKVDMERLKKMSKGYAADKPAATSTKASKKAAPAPRKRGAKIESDDEDDEAYSSTKRRKTTRVEEVEADDDEDDEEDGEVDVDEDEDVEDEEDDDDLFDSDEEEEITKRHAAGQDEEKSATKKSGKVLGRKKKAAPVEKGPRRSGRKVPSKYSDDDEEEEVEDGEERDEDDNQRKNRRVSSGDKRLSKSGGDLHEYETDSDEDDETRRERVAQRLADLKDDSPVAGLDFYLRIQSRRMVLEKWLSEPFFEQAVVGTFLRLSIGECDGQAVYRMCEVIAVEYNQRPYRLESGKMCGVRLTVSLAGSVKKGSKISVVSNSRITHNEFGVFVVEMQKATERNGPSENTHLLTENQVNARRQKQLKASRHVYTHTEIRDMVRKKSGMNKALVTEYSTAMESLIKKRDEARVDKDLDALEAVQKTIDMLEAESKKQKEMNERSSKHSIEVNKRSRESNVQRDMAAGMRKRAEEQEAAAKGTLSNAVLDPFLRRETRPKILWNTGSKLREEQAKENGTFTGPATGGAATNGQSAGAVNGAVPGASAVDAHAPPTVLWSIKNPEATLEEIRKHIKARLGVDPYMQFQENPRERYLRKVCAGLPPLGSEERAALRGKSRSLDEVIEQVRKQREDEAMQQ